MSIKITTLVLGLIGSAIVLIQLGFLANLWLLVVPQALHESNYQVGSFEQIILDVLFFTTFLAFSGSFASYFRPRMGGTALVAAGTVPVAFELFILYASSSKYGGGGGPLLWASVLALEIMGPVFLIVAGALALAK